MGYPGDILSRPGLRQDRHHRVVEPASGRLRWAPIRSLAPRHRDRILTHLLGLPAQDRYLRFGYMASDEQVAAYVHRLDFNRDEVFGVFNRRLDLIAMAHLAIAEPRGDGPSTPEPGPACRVAEFGVSVSPNARGRGLGAQLFDHAAMHARNHGVDTLFIHALTENAAMLAIARKAGATVVREGSEAQAHLRLPAATWATRIQAWWGEGLAQADYRLKRQNVRLGLLRELVHEVRDNVRRERAAPFTRE